MQDKNIKINTKEISHLIDHTVLKPEATKENIKNLCEEAIKYDFFAVCINPSFVSYAYSILKGTKIKIATVAGFPLGATTTSSKVFETKEAIENKADEIDMVLNIGALKEKDYEYVRKDIKSVVEASKGKIVKVIIETCLLTEEEKRTATNIIKEEGAHFVKTSTGFSTGGATVEDVILLRSIVGKDFGVKASGGIRNLSTLLKMKEAGANRIGTSSGVKIIEELINLNNG